MLGARGTDRGEGGPEGGRGGRTEGGRGMALPGLNQGRTVLIRVSQLPGFLSRNVLDLGRHLSERGHPSLAPMTAAAGLGFRGGGMRREGR